MKKFFKDFELYLGSVFLSVTTLIVIMNVFTRYFLNFTFLWAEEIAVGCFVWTIFLGTSAAYRRNSLIGVEVLVEFLPEKGKDIVELITNIALLVLLGIMAYFSYTYVAGFHKITAALEISYGYINSALVLSFGLMTFYTLYYIVRSFKKVFEKKVTNV